MSKLKMNRDKEILYSIGLFDKIHSKINLERMSRCIGLKPMSLKRYLRDLANKGYILYLKNEKRNVFSYRFTMKGMKVRYDALNEIESAYFDGSSNGYPKSISMRTLMEFTIDPYDKMTLFHEYFLNGNRDPIKMMEDIKLSSPNSMVSTIFKETLSLEDKVKDLSLDESLRSTCIYGICGRGSEYDDIRDLREIDDIILNAEILRRQGAVRDARSIYDGLLGKKEGLDSNRWLICVCGSINCKVYENKVDEALKDLDKLIRTVNNPLFKGYLKKTKADIIQDLDLFDEASRLYKSSLGTFNEKDHPCIRASTLNNLGVMYFRMNRPGEATRLWEEAYNIVRRIGVKWSLTMTAINLADAYALQGEHGKASKLLNEARSFLESAGDPEGMSEVDFNMSLVLIEAGDIEGAKRYFRKAEDFPLLYDKKREERIDVFKGRLEKNGCQKIDIP